MRGTKRDQIDNSSVFTLGEGMEMIMPGNDATINVELIAPFAMEKDFDFAIWEGGRSVGAGVFSEIFE